MQRVRRGFPALAIVSLLALSFAGCNTMAGAGRDIEEAGDTIEHSAEKNKRY